MPDYNPDLWLVNHELCQIFVLQLTVKHGIQMQPDCDPLGSRCPGEE